MIPKIRRGAKIGGLMVYLLGEGEHNEHRDRHIVAGSPTILRAQYLQHFDGPGDKEASRETALAVAHVIDVPRKLYGTQVRMKAKPVAVAVGGGRTELGLDVVEPARKGEKSQMRDAPVWHCVLALMPGEEVDDATWAKIANTFMDRMGFTGTKDGTFAQARWAAVRHGHSGEDGEGQDHIHIAASLVREDGSKVSTFDYGPGKARGDWKRADEVCGELEREFGLLILASRKEGGGLSENSRAEIERAKRLGLPETERERLRRAVRAVAVAAEDEADFARGLRAAGIAVRPRYATGGTTEVTGYSVRWQRNGEEVGPWVGGGKLAKDLTLTALRQQQWDDSSDGRQAALVAWKGRSGRSTRTVVAGGEGVEAWQQAAAQVEQWRQRLGEIPHGDHAQWAWMAGQAAGVFAAWSEQLEGDRPGPFAAAATELTRSAQVQYATQRFRPTSRQQQESSVWGDVARLILRESAHAARPRSHRSTDTEDVAAAVVVVVLALMMLLLLAAIAVALAIAQAHRSRGELGRAVAVEDMTRHLDPIRVQWGDELAARREQWDRDAAQVFAAAAGRSTQRAIDDALGTEADAETGDAGVESGGTPKVSVNESVIAAASGPLTAPTLPRGEQPRPRRTRYVELSPQERARVRMRRAADAAFADLDIRPRAWSDARLAEELEHVRTEVRLLGEDLEARRVEGPRTRQALETNASLARAAEKIPDAQEARKAADELERDHSRLRGGRERLAQQLEETSGRKMLARSKLSKQIAERDAQIAELGEQLPAARAAAASTAQATGVPETEWNQILAQAGERSQRARLAAARSQDETELREDGGYLSDLQRDLSMIEAEHARREKLTPPQRDQEAQARANPARSRSTRFPGPASSRAHMPEPRPRDRGPSRDDGLGM